MLMMRASRGRFSASRLAALIGSLHVGHSLWPEPGVPEWTRM